MKLYEKMNEYLANQQVMYIKLHNLHWYVKGRSFFTLHAKLEELYNHTADVMDEVAERLLALEQDPVGSMKKALTLTAVKELDEVPVDSAEAVNKLIVDFEKGGTCIKAHVPPLCCSRLCGKICRYIRFMQLLFSLSLIRFIPRCRQPFGDLHLIFHLMPWPTDRAVCNVHE